MNTNINLNDLSKEALIEIIKNDEETVQILKEYIGQLKEVIEQKDERIDILQKMNALIKPLFK